MTRSLSKLLILLSVFVFIPSVVLSIELINPLRYNTFEELIEAIINFLAFGLAPPIAAIMIIVAGFYFVTAAGDPAKIETAKKIILWVLIGLLVLFCAKGLIALFKTIVGIKPEILPNHVVPY